MPRPTLGFFASLLVLAGRVVSGQELEPRAYTPAPVGINVFLASFSRTEGGVVFDPSLPFTDVDATLNAPAASYARGLGLFGRYANVGVTLPYVWGEVQGNVGEEFRPQISSSMQYFSLAPIVHDRAFVDVERRHSVRGRNIDPRQHEVERNFMEAVKKKLGKK